MTRSAYGTLANQLIVIKKGKGPTALLMAGSHGDEYTGQVTLCRKICEVGTNDIRGRLIIMPIANMQAAMASDRVSPIDHGNLNRSFPGTADMTVTYQIAHYLDTVILPKYGVWSISIQAAHRSIKYRLRRFISLTIPKCTSARQEFSKPSVLRLA